MVTQATSTRAPGYDSVARPEPARTFARRGDPPGGGWRAQLEGATAPFCFSGESFESDDPDLRVLKRTSADPIRLAAS